MEYAPKVKAKKPTFKLNNFEIELLLNDTQLIVRAEHLITLRHFEAIITPEHVKEVTSHIFPDLEFLHLGLLDAFDGKDSAVTLSISDDAQLTYVWERMIRDRKMLEKFTIALIAEEVVDGSNIADRQMEKLLKRVDEQEARIGGLENENKGLRSNAVDMACQIADLMKEVAALKEQVNSQIDKKPKLMGSLTFDPSCANAGFFIFSNVNRTIACKRTWLGWKPVLANNTLPKSQRTRFSIRAEKVHNGDIFIGICPKEAKDGIELYKSTYVYAYIGNVKGGYLSAGERIELKDAKMTNGTIITMIVDLVSNTISFEKNGNAIYASNISPLFDYYPFVEMQAYDNVVTLI